MMDARKIVLSAFICMLSILTAGMSHAKEAEAPFNIASKSAVLMNPNTGQIICAKNPDIPIAPASLTKIMTLVVAYDEIDNGYATLDDQVTISEKAWRTGGSKMFLAVNSKVALQQLLEGIAVVSGNDACVAVAEHIAGVEEVFVEKMNRKASEIGMKNTIFKNSHGLPKKQQTTARDMALLASYYINRHPESLKIHSIKEMTYNSITQKNRNGLLWLDDGFDGLKTGWFSAAGYHIVATAQRDQDRFIAVVLGAQSANKRESIADRLINYGFRNFETIEALDPKQPLAQASVWKGTRDHVALGASQPLKLTIARHKIKDLVVQNDFIDTMQAPVKKGQKFGQTKILVQDQLLATIPLVALENVDRAGFIKLTLHTTMLFFTKPPYWGILLLALLLVAIVIRRFAIRPKKKKPSNYRKRGDDFP